MKDIVIFGAGKIGQEALKEYGDRVAYIIDNNSNVIGTDISGIMVHKVEKYLEDRDRYRIYIASRYIEEMTQQLEKLGVTDYEIYASEFAYYNTSELVVNPYEENPYRTKNENEVSIQQDNSFAIKKIEKEVTQLYNNQQLFNHIEIETVNRCNGSCAFCPVSKGHDTREYMEMSGQLFESIINQLADMNYNGRIALFSNNEPFLDETILEKHKYAREKLPNARFHLFTNGTLLTVEKFTELMKYLDELIIDNYHQNLELIRPCKEIVAYCEAHPELKRKVTIVLRKPKEILTTRGGDAPNRKDKISYGDTKCILPFKQLIIRPDGKVSLCCNDPLGKDTLGDLTKESIMDVWYGERFKQVRDALYKGRKYWEHCVWCDNFSLG